MMPDANSLFPAAPAAACAFGRATVLPLAILLDTGTLLVVGLAAAAPPTTADVGFIVADRRVGGRWQSFVWPDTSGGGGHAFVAVLRAEQAAHLHAVPFDLNGDDGSLTVALPGIERLELDVEPLVGWLGRHSGVPSRIFDFIRATLAAVDGTGQGMAPRCERFLVRLLTAISDHDGFIEIIAEPECGGVLLQGWAMHLPAAPLPVILLAGTLAAEDAAIAHFHRSDLLPTASGFVAYLRCARGRTATGLGQLFFRGDDRYFRLDVVEKRVGLEPDHVVGHLQEMMGRIEGPDASVRALKRVCRPRFCGGETISTLPVPVRVACDLAIHVPGAGLFVSGWLLDPKRLVNLVLVKSTGGFYCRIEDRLVRSSRPDVCAGYRSDALFAECLQPWDTLHGFMAFVPNTEPLTAGEVHYLEVVLDDENCAFLPIHFHDGDRDALLQQILAAVDIDDPDIDRLIGEHLSPFVAGLTAAAAAVRPSEPASVCAFRPADGDGAPPDVSVIVPLGTEWADFDVNLAHFAADADFAAAELVVVAARPAAERIASRLRRAARFYRLRGRLVLSATQCDRFDALALGAAAARSERLLLLSPTVLPTERGWLGRLLAEFAALPDAAALCPTLLYEDHSIRFAGSDGPGTAGGALTAGSFAGYAASAIEASATRPVWAGVLECCCIERSLFTAVGGLDGPYVSPQLKSLDFALRLKAAGGRFHWAPAITLYALDEDDRSEEPHWRRVRHLVDERSFENKWGAALAVPAER